MRRCNYWVIQIMLSRVGMYVYILFFNTRQVFIGHKSRHNRKEKSNGNELKSSLKK